MEELNNGEIMSSKRFRSSNRSRRVERLEQVERLEHPDPGRRDALMKVLKPDAIPAEPANSPLFTGGPVTRQTLLTPEMSNNFNLAVVNFSAGARNKMHTHSSDQVLFVTAGKGIIATEADQEVISVGDVVHIPAEEKHWHGATPDSAFSHIALTTKGSTTTQVEK
jgi:quercetin dioxygenase-like cupin family protein